MQEKNMNININITTSQISENEMAQIENKSNQADYENRIEQGLKDLRAGRSFWLLMIPNVKMKVI